MHQFSAGRQAHAARNIASLEELDGCEWIWDTTADRRARNGSSEGPAALLWLSGNLENCTDTRIIAMMTHRASEATGFIALAAQRSLLFYRFAGLRTTARQHCKFSRIPVFQTSGLGGPTFNTAYLKTNFNGRENGGCPNNKPGALGSLTKHTSVRWMPLSRITFRTRGNLHCALIK